MIASVTFFILAVVAVTAAIAMMLSRNPVNSALWLIVNLFCIAGVYLTLNAQFMAVIQVIVYAGAIMVLFLFVIMLLNMGALPSLQSFNWKLGVGAVLGMALLSMIVYSISLSLGIAPQAVTSEQSVQNGTALRLGTELFTRYMLPFEMIGILLLVATIGAVLLAKRKLT